MVLRVCNNTCPTGTSVNMVPVQGPSEMPHLNKDL
jgi:hypothetical protein